MVSDDLGLQVFEEQVADVNDLEDTAGLVYLPDPTDNGSSQTFVEGCGAQLVTLVRGPRG